MTRYKKGETSEEIRLKKRLITQSIINEKQALQQAYETGQLPNTLSTSNDKVTLGKVQEWHDDDLGIVRYSSNTGLTKNNVQLTEELKSVIGQLNLKLKDKNFDEAKPQKFANRQKTKAELKQEIEVLNERLETMKRTVAEVYMVYKQLSYTVMSEKQDTEKFRDTLKKQSDDIRHKFLRIVK